MKWKRICLLIALLPVTTLFAQSPVISTSVNKTKILIGEQIHLKLQTTFSPENYRVQWFEIPEKIGHFEMISVDKIDTSAGEATVTLAQTLVLTSFDSGKWVIPPFKLSMQQKGKSDNMFMFSDSVTIDVLYSPLDSIEPFHDIKSIIEVKKEDNLWKWIIFGLIAVLTMLLAYWLFKKFRKKQEPEAGEYFPLHPYEEAISALKKLKADRLWEKGNPKEFYGRLSGIFKRYLSGKTATNQMNLTTDEILILVVDKGLDRDAAAVLSSTLKMSDAVKFAKYSPGISAANESVERMEETIKLLNHLINEKAGDI